MSPSGTSVTSVGNWTTYRRRDTGQELEAEQTESSERMGFERVRGGGMELLLALLLVVVVIATLAIVILWPDVRA
jgi:hypothetical protein